MNHKNPDINKADLCASFQKAVADMLIENVKKAISNVAEADTKFNSQNEPIKLVLAGGVSANSYIRNEFAKLEKEENIKIYYPELKLCTDNAAMIASAGYYNYLEENLSDFTLNAVPNLKL